MGRIRLTGATSGFTELRAANAAGNNTITLPTTTGGEVIVSDSSGNVNIDSGTFYVDASNNRVGIGTTSAGGILHTLTTGSDNVNFFERASGAKFGIYNSSVNSYIGTFSNHDLRLATNDTERARIDTSGRLLVGTSSARSNLFNSTFSTLAQLEGAGIGSTLSSFALISNANSNGYQPFVVFAKSRGTVVGSNTIVSSGDTIGTLTFQGSDGSEFVEAALISAEVDGTPGANDMPGRLVFATTADGASSPTERMRITNAGRVLFGAAAPTSENEFFSFQGNNGTLSMFNVTGGASQWPIRTWNTGSSGTINHILFMDGGGTARGSITTNGSSTSFNTTSDYRLKENIELLTGATQRLSQILVHRFNFVGSDARVDGFIAHEVQAVVPEAITGEKDAIDEDGNPVYQGIDQSKLVPLLTAALQEAIGEIESLKARVVALESA